MKKRLTQRGYTLSYHHYVSESFPQDITVIFLGGLMSDMEGTKALHLEAFCKSQDISFIRFDYFGHGSSDGEFTEGTISRWTQDAIDMIDEIKGAGCILVGSSLGGWIMHLAALARPVAVRGLIGIASAPDFTELLIWNQLSDTQKQELMEKGIFQMESDYSEEPYPISKALIEDGREQTILDKPLPLNVPVCLIHGLKDLDVPYDLSLRLAKAHISEYVEVILLKYADHRVSDVESLGIISQALKTQFDRVTPIFRDFPYGDVESLTGNKS